MWCPLPFSPWKKKKGSRRPGCPSLVPEFFTTEGYEQSLYLTSVQSEPTDHSLHSC